MGSAHNDGLYYAQETRHRQRAKMIDLQELRTEAKAAAERGMRIGHYADEAADEIDRLRGALFGLLDKILEVEAHPAFSAVFSMAAVHGCPYTGPNYVAELDVARSLRAADEQKSDT